MSSAKKIKYAPIFKRGEIVCRKPERNHAPFIVLRVTFDGACASYRYFGFYLKSGVSVRALEAEIVHAKIKYDYHRIREYRKGLGYTQGQLAELICVSLSYLVAVESGQALVNAWTLERLANGLRTNRCALIVTKEFD